jgi:hypothetical protein
VDKEVMDTHAWFFEGDKAVLDQSIYDFAPIGKRKVIRELVSIEKEVSATTEKAEALLNPTSQFSKNPTSKQTGKPAMKKVTYEIEEQFHDELKMKAIKEKRTVSEIVNEIIEKGHVDQVDRHAPFQFLCSFKPY